MPRPPLRALAFRVRARRAAGRTCASVPSVVRSVRPGSGGAAEAWIKESLQSYGRRPDAASRAGESLRQLDDRFSFLRPDTVVVDLGCFSGGWSQVAIDRTFAASSTSKVIGIDSVQMDPLRHQTFIHGSVADGQTLVRLRAALAGRRADVVLSDLAPPLTGLKLEDHLGSMKCCLEAAHLMEETLRLGGWFVVKLLWGMEQQNWKTYLQSRFRSVRTIKPPASRWARGEMFCLCRGFLGRGSIAEEVPSPNLDLAREGLDSWGADVR